MTALKDVIVIAYPSTPSLIEQVTVQSKPVSVVSNATLTSDQIYDFPLGIPAAL